MVAERWAPLGECGLVVGATFPRQLAEVRAIVGDLPILVPAIGEQKGDVRDAVLAGRTDSGTGLLVSSSRAILYASRDDGFRGAGPGRGDHDARRHPRRALILGGIFRDV